MQKEKRVIRSTGAHGAARHPFEFKAILREISQR